MTSHPIVSEEQWIEAMRALTAEEKAITQAQQRLAEQRRALPWVRIDKPYMFEGVDGPMLLADLFDGRSQLIVQHFMFGRDWSEGCQSCSLLADHIDGARRHFEHNDVSYAAVSRASIEKIAAYRQRMGWRFRWVSSARSDFNIDHHVSFAGDRSDGVFYNFERRPDPQVEEMPGFSIFHRAPDGAIYRTYACYARGLEKFIGVYAFLDVVPHGRNETKTGMMHDWLKRHDRYENDGRTQPVSAVMIAAA
ncbi:MAG: thioredoxin family protein [Pseudomonadota bacterium]